MVTATRMRRVFWLLLVSGLIAAVTLAVLPASANYRSYDASLIAQQPILLRPAEITEYAVDAGINDLLVPPYTVIARAGFSGDSDRQAGWGLVFCPLNTATDCSSEQIHLTIFADGFFRLSPVSADTTWFVHIRPNGQENEVQIEVAADGKATLSINNEIAWQGKLGVLRRMSLSVLNGESTISKLTVVFIQIRKPLA
ncbi:MAG: hypothetical protein KF726_11750 [Anaerolineae bacterium]|nr:hypothetical protein [Anaerolineae bacterium]